MNRFFLLLFVALVTFGIVFLVKRPDVVKNFWLWAIGLSGFVLRIIQIIGRFLSDRFSDAGDWLKKEKDQAEEKLQQLAHKK